MANQTLQKKLNSDKKWLKAKCLKLSVNITMEDSVNTNLDVDTNTIQNKASLNATEQVAVKKT